VTAPTATSGPARTHRDAWTVGETEDTRAHARLFCFPYAGVGASVFDGWAAALSPDIAVTAIQLPGRERRLREPLLSSMADVTDRLVEVLPPLLDRPYAFFGHSMGARIACALAHRLRAEGHREPVRLFASGSPGPASRIPVGGADASDEGLVAWLRQLGGTPDEVLENRDLLDLLLPMIRADVGIVRSWVDTPRQPLDCPIRAFVGTGDGYATPSRVRAWSAETSSLFALTVVPGGHIFLQRQARTLQRVVGTDLARKGDADDGLIGGQGG
jgi:surfactin synthase thioesterase subunit